MCEWTASGTCIIGALARSTTSKQVLPDVLSYITTQLFIFYFWHWWTFSSSKAVKERTCLSVRDASSVWNRLIIWHLIFTRFFFKKITKSIANHFEVWIKCTMLKNIKVITAIYSLAIFLTNSRTIFSQSIYMPFPRL